MPGFIRCEPFSAQIASSVNALAKAMQRVKSAHEARNDRQQIPHRQAGQVPPGGFRSGRHLRPRPSRRRSQGDARRRRRSARRLAGDALRAGPLVGARDLPGDGRGRQGRRDQARDVRRQSAGLPGALLQGAERAKSSTTISSGASPRRCPSAGASASSTARTTRKCWWCACTRKSSRKQQLAADTGRQGHLGGALRRASATSRATSRATAR